jgi:hypothetical protein
MSDGWRAPYFAGAVIGISLVFDGTSPPGFASAIEILSKVLGLRSERIEK